MLILWVLFLIAYDNSCLTKCLYSVLHLFCSKVWPAILNLMQQALATFATIMLIHHRDFQQ